MEGLAGAGEPSILCHGSFDHDAPRRRDQGHDLACAATSPNDRNRVMAHSGRGARRGPHRLHLPSVEQRVSGSAAAKRGDGHQRQGAERWSEHDPAGASPTLPT